MLSKQFGARGPTFLVLFVSSFCLFVWLVGWLVGLFVCFVCLFSWFVYLDNSFTVVSNMTKFACLLNSRYLPKEMR